MEKLNLKQKKKLLITIMVFSCFLSINAQFPADIIKATKTANAEAISKHFNNKVELVLPERSDIFSTSQAKLVLNEFFRKNPPKNFEIIHQGVRKNSSFAIGKYLTQNNVYRFYFLIKIEDGKTYIHQIRIENEND